LETASPEGSAAKATAWLAFAKGKKAEPSQPNKYGSDTRKPKAKSHK